MFLRRSLIALAPFATCLALATGGAVAALPVDVTTFPIQPCSRHEIAAAPSGAYVRTCDAGDIASSTTLTNLLPDGGSNAIAVPASEAGPIATGPAGEVWLGARNAGDAVGGAGRIERIAADGTVQVFPLAPGSHIRLFRGLVVDRHGVAWVAIGEPYGTDLLDGPAYDLGELLRIAPDGSERHFPLPPGTEPQGLAIGPGGDIWFTAISGHLAGWKVDTPGSGHVGRLKNGRMKLFPTPVAHGYPQAITLGPEGKLWFAQANAAAIGTVSAGGKFGREYKLRSEPLGARLAFGPEGDLWVALGKGLLQLTPSGGRTFYPGRTDEVAIATDGSIWALGWAQVRRIVPRLGAGE